MAGKLRLLPSHCRIWRIVNFTNGIGSALSGLRSQHLAVVSDAVRGNNVRCSNLSYREFYAADGCKGVIGDKDGGGGNECSAENEKGYSAPCRCLSQSGHRGQSCLINLPGH